MNRLLFKENKSWYFMWIVNKSWYFIWIVCQADNSHEISRLVFFEKKKKKKNNKCRLLQVLLGILRVKPHSSCLLTVSITKTRLYDFDPLKPHFYIVKLGFTGVYISFLIFAQNIDCGYSLEPPRWGSSNEYPQSMFWAEILKTSKFFIWKFSGFERWYFLYIWIGEFS